MTRRVMALLSIPFLSLFFGVVILGWGDIESFFAHPARAGFVLVTVVLFVVSLPSGMNASAGQREDRRNRWIFIPLAMVVIAFTYGAPTADRRDLLTLDGDTVRYLGLALYAAGGGLRVWSMFALGRRFSGLVAIQQDHELETRGIYAFVRHPSYLGAILAFVGWALVFRSGLALLLVPALIWIVVARIAAEEQLLESEFGQSYGDYRRRTRRLIPFVY